MVDASPLDSTSASDAPPEPRVVDCVGAYGCAGQQTCVGDECDECGGCTDIAGLAWTIRPGEIVDLHSRGDGSVVVLLASSPWLVRVEMTGERNNIPVEMPLEIGQNVFVASDGSIYVHRRPSSRMEFHKFTETGELVWSFSRIANGSFAGFAEDAAGAVLGGWFRNGAMDVLDLTDGTDGDRVARATFSAPFSGSRMSDFEVLSDTSFVIAANSDADANAFYGTLRDGAGSGIYVTPNESGSISNVIPGEDQVYVGHGSLEGDTTYELVLESFSLEPTRRLWRHTYSVAVNPSEFQPSNGRIYERAPVAQVESGLVFGTGLIDPAGGGPSEHLQLFGLDGERRGTIGGAGPVQKLVPAGDNAFYVVWTTRRVPDASQSLSLVELPPG